MRKIVSIVIILVVSALSVQLNAQLKSPLKSVKSAASNAAAGAKESAAGVASNAKEAATGVATEAKNTATATVAEAKSAAFDKAFNDVGAKISGWMDQNNVVVGEDSKYAEQLSALTGKFTSLNGVTLNYKAYESSEIVSYAFPDGGIRVSTALIDAFTSEELFGLLANQIGHVINLDTREALVKAISKDNANQTLAVQIDKLLSLSGEKLGTFVNDLIGTPYTDEQETKADEYAYNLLKDNEKKVTELISALNKLATGAVEAPKYTNVHPGSEQRVIALKAKAEADNLK
ncbi:MAG: M48 family metalloprotease [Prevotellaceae bacterium]|jgi:putative metalloprotease|nr:M48 family metalloprotease [Prevotellaceae bacterium]